MKKVTKTPEQLSFSQAEYGAKKKLTRCDIFLAEMEQVVPWSRLISIIEPHSPKGGQRGRPPIGIERMLRMYFIQQWYGLADVAGGGCHLRQPVPAQLLQHRPERAISPRCHHSHGLSSLT